MLIQLVDLNSKLTLAWESCFRGCKEVKIVNSSIFEVEATALISPANSYGFMDGGIDVAYLRYFGQSIQNKVRELIYSRPEGMLPVGAAELVYTDHAQFPILIVAPTMEFPEAVPPFNAYRAFRAVLRLLNHYDWIDAVSCPGLCTGIGKVQPEEAAIMMARAYKDWKAQDKV